MMSRKNFPNSCNNVTLIVIAHYNGTYKCMCTINCLYACVVTHVITGCTTLLLYLTPVHGPNVTLVSEVGFLQMEEFFKTRIPAVVPWQSLNGT